MLLNIWKKIYYWIYIRLWGLKYFFVILFFFNLLEFDYLIVLVVVFEVEVCNIKLLNI